MSSSQREDPGAAPEASRAGSSPPHLAPAAGRGSTRLGLARALQASLVGLSLGLLQLSLGFGLMRGAGASAALFFGLIACWIGGGAFGSRSVRTAKAGLVWLLLSLLLLLFALVQLERASFAPSSAWLGLGAAFGVGGYAGAFLAERSASWGSARRVLLHENNGFILGYALGTFILLGAASLLEPSVSPPPSPS